MARLYLHAAPTITRMGMTERRVRKRMKKFIPESEPTIAWDVTHREDEPFGGLQCSFIVTERAVYALTMKGMTAMVTTMPWDQMVIAAVPFENYLAIEYVADNGEQRLLRCRAMGTFKQDFLTAVKERAPRWQSYEDMPTT